MANLQGFWSYVHDDDQSDGGRIIRLARDVVEQFQMVTGDTITLFLDKDDIEWGDKWREIIDGNLATVAFFIPVLTPRYFLSPECRREMQSFIRKATELGIKDLVLPLLYVDVPLIHDETNKDDLINIVRSFQWEDWRDIRFKEISSEEYRRGVYRLANKLVDANRQAESAEIPELPLAKSDTPVEAIDESPGLIDQLAKYEETIPQLNDTLLSITGDIELIGDIMKEGADDIQRADSQGKGFAARLLIARRVSQKLNDPAERIYLLSNKYSSQLHDVDEGIRIIIEQAPMEIKETPDSSEKLVPYFRSVRKLSVESNVSSGSTQKMIEAIAPLEKMSRDMRPVLRKLKQGLTLLVESRDITDDWAKLIESSGVKIDDQENPRQ